MNEQGCIRGKRHQYWLGKRDFLMSAICCVLGLRDLSMFPLLVNESGGGGGFYLPYVISMLCVGMPTLVIEISLGQFSSSGLLTCWGFCPLLSGCGINMLILLCLLAIYFNALTGWGIHFLFLSLTSDIPWTHCGNWSTRNCIDNVNIINKYYCSRKGKVLPNGVCEHSNDADQLWIWNEKLARQNNVILTYPTFEYFQRVTLENPDKNFSIDHYSTDVLLSLLLASTIIWMFVLRGIRISAKVAVLILVLPFSILLAFVIRGISLDGGIDGILYFLTLQKKEKVPLKVWNFAARHVCFSLSVAYGSFIALASYNKFHYDILRDVIIISAVDCAAGMLSGIFVFSHLGYLANNLNLDIGGLTTEACGLEVLPYVITKLAAPTTWNALFFLMIIVIGINSERIILEAVVISLTNWKPALQEKKFLTCTVICLAIFIASIPMTTSESFVLLRLISFSSGELNILIFAFIENFAIGWLYGADRFIRDVEIMIQGRYCSRFTFGRICRIWWKICWKYITPIGIMLCIILWGFDEGHLQTPKWITWIGWVITLILIAVIVSVAVHQMFKVPGTTKERWIVAVSPTREWGPVLEEYRQLVVSYIPNFVVNLDDRFDESVNPDLAVVATEQMYELLDDVTQD